MTRADPFGEDGRLPADHERALIETTMPTYLIRVTLHLPDNRANDPRNRAAFEQRMAEFGYEKVPGEPTNWKLPFSAEAETRRSNAVEKIRNDIAVAAINSGIEGPIPTVLKFESGSPTRIDVLTD